MGAIDLQTANGIDAEACKVCGALGVQLPTGSPREDLPRAAASVVGAALTKGPAEVCKNRVPGWPSNLRTFAGKQVADFFGVPPSWVSEAAGVIRADSERLMLAVVGGLVGLRDAYANRYEPAEVVNAGLVLVSEGQTRRLSEAVGQIHRSRDRWVHGTDCRRNLPYLESASVSLLLTDPPYFLHKMDSEWDHNDLRDRIKPGVVGGLPVGMRFDRQQAKRLYDFLLPIAEEWARVVRPGGFALCFSQGRLVHRVASALEDAGFEIRDILCWTFEGQAKAFSQDHFVQKMDLAESEKERIIWELGGRKTPQLKAQYESIVVAQLPKEGTFVQNWMKWETGLIDVSAPVLQPEQFPGQVIPCAKENRMFGHMTVKPVNLLRHLIRIFSKEGALVLDPFSGTGSTGVAARSERRSFLGYEIDPAMALAACVRIDEVSVE